jgi:long-chain acyl-CoA synthetase
VVDRDDPTREVPVGEPGELAVQGPQVFRGYWGSDAPAGPRTDDGYLLTGDVVVMDADGFFTLVDRKKDLIITGGFNVYPSEVEEVLAGIPGVQDAVVAGVPDRYRGEHVKAFVVRAPDSDLTAVDVVEHCRQHLSAYKVPRAVEFRDDLPRSVVGKVLRRLLVEQTAGQAAGQTAGQAAEQAVGKTAGQPAEQAVGGERKSGPPGGRSDTT